MSWALKQISHSPFSQEIESTDFPRRFTRPTFTIFDGKINPVEYVSHYNQSMTVYAKNEALMCKIFPSSLGPTTMRWFDGLEKDFICGYNELIRAFEARFVTCIRTRKPFDYFLTMYMKEGETLRAYSNHYWELYNEIDGDNGGIAASTFKVGLSMDSS
nr:uncharacterized protein LOC112007735 [Quercus suber]